MRQFTTTVIDTTGIQNYIFGSNSLRHNGGASGLVHCATHDWVSKELDKLGGTNVDREGNLNDAVTIEEDDLNSELVYTGGGNTVIVFRTAELARDFTKQLTRRTLLDAPGLRLVIRHTDFDWDNNNLKKTISDTIHRVNQKKFDRFYSTPLLGLGVTADCQYTGLPAVKTRRESEDDPEKKEVRISNEVAAKWDFFKEADKRLYETVSLDRGFEYIYRFDDFGTKHESSYIAVVHADGNGIGERFKNIAKEDNREYIMAARDFSGSLEGAAKEALQASVTRLQESIEDGKIGFEINKNDNGKKLLPFRPIVFGGDDVTFVCDGRLGITLAEFFLSKLTSHELSDGDLIFARAGVAIVKSHYPFSRAVTLSERLAESAKTFIKESTHDKKNLSAIDWHFASTGPVVDDLADIRKRDYTFHDYGREMKLNMRPLRLGGSVGPDWHSWDTFTSIVNKFKSEWIDKRNKLMALREVLRAGPDAVEQFITAYKLPHLLEIPGNPESDKTGWVSNECTCFDAIEAIDFFIPLDGGGT